MTTQSKSALVLAAALLLMTGCKKTADNTINYKSTINAYYSAHPACLWSDSQKFPAQVGASDTSKTAPFDALVDQGLLVRSTSEKKIIIISKQETNYDLSDKGRSAWTPDTAQPGFGNFCYGTPTVSSLDNATPNSGAPGATTAVTYHYSISNAPGWATAAETQNAFPRVAAAIAGGTATATLVDTDNGWQMQTPPPVPTNPNTPNSADGKIVE